MPVSVVTRLTSGTPLLSTNPNTREIQGQGRPRSPRSTHPRASLRNRCRANPARRAPDSLARSRASDASTRPLPRRPAAPARRPRRRRSPRTPLRRGPVAPDTGSWLPGLRAGPWAGPQATSTPCRVSVPAVRAGAADRVLPIGRHRPPAHTSHLTPPQPRQLVPPLARDPRPSQRSHVTTRPRTQKPQRHHRKPALSDSTWSRSWPTEQARAPLALRPVGRDSWHREEAPPTGPGPRLLGVLCSPAHNPLHRAVSLPVTGSC